jgi:hypothetical protein
LAIEVKWFGLGLLDMLEAPRDLEAETLKLALVKAAYTPDRDTQDFWNDVSGNELAEGNGYVTGGKTLAGVATSYDSASDQVRLDFNDVTWEFTASQKWKFAVLYIDTAGASSTDPVIGLLSWDSEQAVSTSFTLVIDAAGLLYIDTT